MIPHQNFRRLLKVAVLLFLAARSHADPILSLTFDDPNGVFKGYPEGISLPDTQSTATISEAEIASGFGGKVRLMIDSTEWVEGTAEPPKSFQLVADPVMGPKAFLRLINDKQVPGTRGFVVITPDGIETSLGALSQNEKGKVVLNGGLDLFFRCHEDDPQQEILPHLLWIGGDGLRLVVESDAGTLAASFSDEENGTIFDTDLDGTADAAMAKTSFVKATPIESDAVYHLALAFETSDAGIVTVKVFLKAGNGAINTKEDVDLVSKGSFSVITDDTGKTLRKSEFSIGAGARTSQLKAIVDLAAFRIFKPAPATFPDILGKE
jgi:hypothetical protein